MISWAWRTGARQRRASTEARCPCTAVAWSRRIQEFILSHRELQQHIVTLRETTASIGVLLADSDAARDRRIMFATCLPDGTLGALCNNVLEPKWSSAGCVSTGLQFVCTVLALCLSQNGLARAVSQLVCNLYACCCTVLALCLSQMGVNLSQNELTN